MAAKLVLERRRLWKYDRVHAHQGPLHEESQADQSVRDYARWPTAKYTPTGRGSACCESCVFKVTQTGRDDWCTEAVNMIVWLWYQAYAPFGCRTMLSIRRTGLVSPSRPRRSFSFVASSGSMIIAPLSTAPLPSSTTSTSSSVSGSDKVM